MTLFGLLLLPLLVAGVMFFLLKATITWKEFLLQVGAAVLITVLGFLIAKHQSMSAVENINGRITQKIKTTQSCCHCHTECSSTDSKGNCTSHRTVCDHSLDYMWYLESTVGDIPIDNCEPSSVDPKAWTNAYVGEPATVENSYTNYLKADKDSLIVHNSEKWKNSIPDYPEVHSHYKVLPVVSSGVIIPDNWQAAIRNINADLGKKHQVDIAILLTNNPDPTYSQAVESKWLYGPKNSLTVVLGIDSARTVKWARVVTISKVESLKIHLRDQLQGMNIDGNQIPDTIRSLVSKEFKRTPMAEFEYLAANAEPTTGWMVLLYILGVAVSVGMGYWMHKEDLFQGRAVWNRLGRREGW